MIVLLTVVGAIVSIAVGAIWKGFVLSVLWRWFMVPIFGLPELSLVVAIGVGLVISFLTYQHIEIEPAEEESFGYRFGKALFAAIFYPAIALFFGWIVHLFM